MEMHETETASFSSLSSYAGGGMMAGVRNEISSWITETRDWEIIEALWRKERPW